jgi:hypothetical protein
MTDRTDEVTTFGTIIDKDRFRLTGRLAEGTVQIVVDPVRSQWPSAS